MPKAENRVRLRHTLNAAKNSRKLYLCLTPGSLPKNHPS